MAQWWERLWRTFAPSARQHRGVWTHLQSLTRPHYRSAEQMASIVGWRNRPYPWHEQAHQLVSQRGLTQQQVIGEPWPRSSVLPAGNAYSRREPAACYGLHVHAWTRPDRHLNCLHPSFQPGVIRLYPLLRSPAQNELHLRATENGMPHEHAILPASRLRSRAGGGKTWPASIPSAPNCAVRASARLHCGIAVPGTRKGLVPVGSKVRQWLAAAYILDPFFQE